MKHIALNGLGRIGKLLFRRLLDEMPDVDIAWVNDISGTAEQHALLLEFDSVHGPWSQIRAEGDTLVMGDRRIPFRSEANLAALPLDGLELVIDCTGAFKTPERLQPYFDGGVPRVLVSAPVKAGQNGPHEFSPVKSYSTQFQSQLSHLS